MVWEETVLTLFMWRNSVGRDCTHFASKWSVLSHLLSLDRACFNKFNSHGLLTNYYFTVRFDKMQTGA
jgi:hypothetical protein